MALPADYRIVAVNSTGVSIDAGLLVADIKPYSGDGSGGLSHNAEQTGSGGANAGSSVTLVSVSGSTAVGLNGNVNGNLSGNGSVPSGDLEWYIERSTDGGTSYERDPTPIAVLNFTSKTDKSTTISA